MRYGSVELGGTKVMCGVGGPDGTLEPVVRIPTTDPSDTLAQVAGFFSEHSVAAIGVACFGPVVVDRDRPDYGTVLATPKPGWAGTPVLATLSAALEVPVALDTDVNGAALGEWRWGAGRGSSRLVFVTVGTGIGGGAVVEGRPQHGNPHPEMGHIVVRPHPGDPYPGFCAFHGGCLEGLASGPALADRFGVPVEELEGSRRDRAIALVAWYLAQGLRNVVYTLSPDRIVVGGGVSRLPGLFQALRPALDSELARYPVPVDVGTLVVPPELGDRSALAGGLLLAESVVK